jgi:tRNA 2-(methylsulfanyl)-N6-isopentenyladenosine37 hydroxylase
VTTVVTTPTPVQFLDGATPEEWLGAACARLPQLLQDHANCELKAASTALSLIYRYPERTSLAQRMSRLAREELRHYEQVRKLLDEMEIPFVRLTASRYASTLMRAVRPGEPERLLDTLLAGALIEARSCERFGALAPRLPSGVGRFYAGLLESEARHFAHYLELARTESGVADAEVERRLSELKQLESSLILEPDPQFRFHSGIPSA